MAKIDAGPGVPKREVSFIKAPEGYTLVDWDALEVGDEIQGVRRPVYGEVMNKNGTIREFTWEGRVRAIDKNAVAITIGTSDNRVIPINNGRKQSIFFPQKLTELTCVS